MTLNRPDALNALDSRMRGEWAEVWEVVRRNDDIRVALLTGAGERAFCVGSDLKERTAESAYITTAFSAAGDGHLLKSLSFDKPLVCAINGHALGGGLEIALACDIRLSSRNATMALPEVRVGSTPGAGGTQNLPRAVSASDAMYLLLTGEQVSAERALQMGLVSECLDAPDLMPRARAIAETIADNAPISVRATKRLAKASRDMPLPYGLDAERNVWGLLKATDDRAEGRAAFQEKRPPVYRGR